MELNYMEYAMNIFQMQNFLWLVFGAVIGITLGALPGLNGGLAVAVLLPLTYNLDPVVGLIMLGSVMSTSSFGGNITAILLNTPGTSDSLFMVLDGYPMTLKGKGTRGIIISTVSSFIGGTIGILALIFIAPPLAQIAIKFGPLEMFLISLLGIVIIVSLSKGNMLKGGISACIGFFAAVVGTDVYTGVQRYTFGFVEVADSLPLIPTVIGLFAVSQMFALMVDKRESIVTGSIDKRKNTDKISLPELITLKWHIIRSSIIGTIIGIIPAAGSTVACGLSYDIAKKTSDTPEKFGKGSEAGLAAASAANNAVFGGSLVPLLTLGIPGTGMAIFFLTALLVHGIYPGVQLFTQHADVVYTFMFAMLFCQLFILAAGLFGGRFFAKITVVPTKILVPCILVLAILGAYAGRYLMFDLYLLIGFGILGYFLTRVNVPLAPFVLSFVLGPIIETQFRRALQILSSDMITAVTKPLPLVLILINIALLVMPFISFEKKIVDIVDEEADKIAS